MSRILEEVAMSKLVILVPAGRRSSGSAMLFGDDGSLRMGPLSVLATASGWAARRHGNPTRDWRRPYGHPPTGSYVVAGSLPPRAAPRPARLRRFGPLGALVLTPVGGDAAVAAQAGRQRFLVHGGPPDGHGRLRPTFGGFRFSDRDLGALFRAINAAFAEADPLSTVEVAETTPSSGQGDRAGRFRPDDSSRGASGLPKVPVKHAALLALGGGVVGRRLDAAMWRRPNRRDFVGLALLTLGASGSTGCGSGDDQPGAPPGCVPGPGGANQDGGSGAATASGDGGGARGGYGTCGEDAIGGGGDVTGGDVGGGGG